MSKLTLCAMALVATIASDLSAQIPTWTLSEHPSASIGDGFTEAHELFLVTDATVLSDGRIVILNAGSQEIRVFTSDGGHLNTFGGPGDGPGDFRYPVSLREVSPDQLIVYDRVQKRLTFTSASGEIRSSKRLNIIFDEKSPLPAQSNVRPARSGLRPFLDGTMPVANRTFSMQDQFQRRPGIQADSIVLSRHDGDQLSPVFLRELGRQFLARDGSSGLTKPIPFGELLIFAVGREGVVTGTSHKNDFDLLATDGSTVGRFHAEGTPRRPTRGDWKAFETQFRSRNSTAVQLPGIKTADPLRRVEMILNDSPRGEYVPLFDRIILDDLGRLWVREFVLESESAEWQVLDRGRGLIARLTMPARWTILEFGQDYVLVKDRDEFNVELVREFQIIEN